MYVYGVAQWFECQPANQKVTGLSPIQGTCLSFRPGSQFWACERQPADVSFMHALMFLSLSLPFLKIKIKSFLKKKCIQGLPKEHAEKQ